MYKLFLCLRYLRKRIMAYFAIAGVALCVFMMLISVSIMNGFLEKIEGAAKGLFGDIVMEGPSAQGIARYDEFIEEVKRSVLDDKTGKPMVLEGSPFIISVGFLRVPYESGHHPVQVAGIRLPERAMVSNFAAGLHFQQTGAPTFDPPWQQLADNLARERQQTEDILRALTAKSTGATIADEDRQLASRLSVALVAQESGEFRLRNATRHQRLMEELVARIAQARTRGADENDIGQLEEELAKLSELLGIRPPDHHVILGRSVLNFRTPQGQVIRGSGSPGLPVVLDLYPLGRRSLDQFSAVSITRTFTVIDDCRTDVSNIDSNVVYVPFETLQKINGMAAEPLADGSGVLPGRCSQIHFKVAPEFSNGRALEEVNRKIQAGWENFRKSHPDVAYYVSIETWRQRQRPLISQIGSQRTLVAIMFSVISMVAVVLIFVLFYTIVFQKTKDIGVMKAVGASGTGVVQIFLGYGAAVGLVGSIIGTIGGYFFVRHINPIHDWVGRTFGFQVWTREWFLFDEIPSAVQPLTAAVIALGSVAAGLVGALLPAVLAGRMEPVEALRYE